MSLSDRWRSTALWSVMLVAACFVAWGLTLRQRSPGALSGIADDDRTSLARTWNDPPHPKAPGEPGSGHVPPAPSGIETKDGAGGGAYPRALQTRLEGIEASLAEVHKKLDALQTRVGELSRPTVAATLHASAIESAIREPDRPLEEGLLLCLREACTARANERVEGSLAGIATNQATLSALGPEGATHRGSLESNTRSWQETVRRLRKAVPLLPGLKTWREFETWLSDNYFPPPSEILQEWTRARRH